MEKEKLPQLKEPYSFNEEQSSIIDRFKEELEYRLHTKVSFEAWTENFLAYPLPRTQNVTIELVAGNWKRQIRISMQEIELGHGEAFYYFMRRVVDDTMADLLQRGANTY